METKQPTLDCRSNTSDNELEPHLDFVSSLDSDSDSDSDSEEIAARNAKSLERDYKRPTDSLLAPLCQLDTTTIPPLLIYPCPHCELLVSTAVNEINCGIFRHCSNLTTNVPINPHASQVECERYLEQRECNIVGCGKPYRIECIEPERYRVSTCDYI